MATSTITACSNDASLKTANRRNRNPRSNSEMSVDPRKLCELVPHDVSNEPSITRITPMSMANAVPAPMSAAHVGVAGEAGGSSFSAGTATGRTVGGNNVAVGAATVQLLAGLAG